MLLLDEIAGGLGEHEVHELVEVIRRVHREGVAIIWIEHIVHALRAVVGRLAVISAGRMLVEARPMTSCGARKCSACISGSTCSEPAERPDLSAFYGRFQALFDVSLEAAEGETVAVIGANGAGKTTFLRAVAGALPVPAAAVRFGGDRWAAARPTSSWPSASRWCPKGGGSSPASASKRTSVGPTAGGPGLEARARVRAVPGARRAPRQPGTNLSGGEQQMLAIGRGLMANPRLLLVDEISLGLAPVVVQRPLPTSCAPWPRRAPRCSWSSRT